MSKRRVGLLVAAALALSTVAYLYLRTPHEKSAAHASARNDSAIVPALTSPGQQTKNPGLQPAEGGAASSIPASMSPERAYANAYAILRCTHAANSDLKLPPDMTGGEKAQFEKSRVAGLDCSALDSKYSVYELAKFAAEKGNIKAQLDFSALAASIFKEEKNALDPMLIAQYKSDSLKFLNMAASAGNSDAYARLAANYQTGLFSDKDKVKAYAYAYAHDQVTDSSISSSFAERFSRGLSAEELLRAQQLGQSLINGKRP